MKKLILIFTLLLCMSNFALSQGWDSTTLNNNNITSDLTLNASTRYVMKGFVYVKPPATLTIPAGTVIYGDKATTGTLIIERGAKINATGTAMNPIVFTSRLDSGQKGPGDWGGIILLGLAEINTVSGADTAAIEGLPSYVQPAYYGGHDNNDNSGVLKYVRIEFPGINLTGVSGNEINGLTMGGIGKNTTLEYIQVSYSGDDSYEWFGGNVNAKYLISYKCIDDAFDTDNGYRGMLQFIIDVKDSIIADVSGTNGFESDNNANSPINFRTPRTHPIISNATMIGPLRTLTSTVHPNHKRGCHIRRNSLLCLYNSIMMGFKVGTRFDSEGVANACTGDTVQFNNNIYAGNITLADTANMNGNGFDGIAFLQTTAIGNRVFVNNTEVNLTNPYGYENNGSWIPLTGSPALTGGTFTYPNLSDPFFTPTTYVGAFGSTDWTSGWAHFDPINVGVKKISSEVPSDFNLSQNYPNPFNPTTKINFSVPQAGFVSLKVYDVTGKLVANLFDEKLSIGTYEYEFDGSNLSSGTYFYTLSTDKYRETKKMMLIK